MRKLGIISWGILAALVPAGARASGGGLGGDCVLVEHGDTLYLKTDCQTDETLFIPEGKTLDGRHHWITAVDPPDGPFRGAVVQNAGTEAHVRNLVIDTHQLENVCNESAPSDERLRGIYFHGASGSIVHNQVLNVRKENDSGCQEGQGIEVRATEGDSEVEVYIIGNQVKKYQKTGILAVGSVQVQIYLNEVEGLGPVDFIAQNAIQLSAGARGSVKYNRIRDNLYTPATYASTGILLLSAGEGIGVSLNRVFASDVGIRVVSTSEARVSGNKVTSSTYDGIAVDGMNGTAQSNRVWGNRLEANGVGVDLFGEGATGNRVARNLVEGNEVGMQMALGADANVLHKNRVFYSGEFGVWIGTDDNRVTRNLILGTEGEGLVNEGVDNVITGNFVW